MILLSNYQNPQQKWLICVQLFFSEWSYCICIFYVYMTIFEVDDQTHQLSVEVDRIVASNQLSCENEIFCAFFHLVAVFHLFLRIPTRTPHSCTYSSHLHHSSRCCLVRLSMMCPWNVLMRYSVDICIYPICPVTLILSAPSLFDQSDLLNIIQYSEQLTIRARPVWIYFSEWFHPSTNNFEFLYDSSKEYIYKLRPSIQLHINAKPITPYSFSWFNVICCNILSISD